MTVSLVGRLRMTACHFTTISLIWRSFENLFVGIISTVLNNQNNVNPIVFGCIWLVWFLQRKKCLTSSFLCTGIHGRKVPMASIEETGAAKDGGRWFVEYPNPKLISRHFCCVEGEKMVQDVGKNQHWKHSQGWRNSCTHGG